MNWLQNGVTQLVDGVKQLIKVDIGGGTVMLIAESAVISEKRPKGQDSFLIGHNCKLSTSVGAYISSVVVALLILAGNTAR